MTPIGLDGAMAGWAGGQDFRAATRAENEIFLNRCPALGAGPRPYRGFSNPGIRLDWLLMRIVEIMQKVRSAHWFYLHRLVS